MADPVIETLVANVWKKVATNVTTGLVHINEKNPPVGGFIHTYRDTGGATPTSQSEGVAFDGVTEIISSTVGIDVYIMAKGGSGKVRVDLA